MVDVNNNEVKEVKPDFENEVLVSPQVNIYENDNEFVLVADMPGVAKEDINVKFEDKFLTIYGKVTPEKEDIKYILKETSCGNYYRNFILSDKIDIQKIDASYENGKLKVVMPKNERIKPKNISIK